jgi:endo-1,4-beta-xylanase
MIEAIAFAALALGPGQFTTSGLRPEALRLGMNLGTAVQSDALKNNMDSGLYRSAVSQNMTMIEPENDLKPASLWKGIGQYDFSKPDYLLGAPGQTGWAQANRMKVRGHVLLYPNEPGYTTPQWLLNMESQLTTAQVRDLLRDYIYTVAGRYAGKIAMWDVVNAAIADSLNTRPFNLRNSFWYRKLGTEFLVLAFRYAAEADPSAKLYYNDYGIERGGWKADSVVNMLNFIRQSGVRVDGIGLQYHIGLWDSFAANDAHYQVVNKFELNNYDWQVTELDVAIDVVQYPSTNPLYGLVPVRQSDLQSQSALYNGVFKLGLSSPRCKGIQMWGITDKLSWIPQFTNGSKGAASLLNGSYAAKPAYSTLLKLLRSSR